MQSNPPKTQHSLKCLLMTYPKEVSGYVALSVTHPCPPPLNLVLVLSADDGHAVPLLERQLIWVFAAVVPKAVDHSSIHDAHLLLHS